MYYVGSLCRVRARLCEPLLFLLGMQAINLVFKDGLFVCQVCGLWPTG